MEDWQTLGYLCSFCGKSTEEVFYIVAGPAVYICDECILLCSQIVGEAFHDWKRKQYQKEIGYNLGVTFTAWEYR